MASETSPLTCLAAEAAVGIDNRDVELEAIGFIRDSPNGPRAGGPIRPIFEVLPAANGEPCPGPSSLTVPRRDEFCRLRARAARQSFPAGAGGAVGSRVGGGATEGRAPSVEIERSGTAAGAGARDDRPGSPNRGLGATIEYEIGFKAPTLSSSSSPTSSHSLEFDSFPGDASLLDPVWTSDMVFSSVRLFSDLNRIVLPAGRGRFPSEVGLSALRLTSDFLPGVPGALRRGEAWSGMPLTRATALLTAGPWNTDKARELAS
jgi:hypothetical protein